MWKTGAFKCLIEVLVCRSHNEEGKSKHLKQESGILCLMSEKNSTNIKFSSLYVFSPPAYGLLRESERAFL